MIKSELISQYLTLTNDAHIDGYVGIGAQPNSSTRISVAISLTDPASGVSGGIFNATSNTTVSASNATIGINGVATALVQTGAENDKTVGGMNFAVTRGDGTDEGIMDAMNGANVIMTNNAGAAGVTQKAYGFSSVLISQAGTLTDLYDYYSLRVPAGGTVTNHYGVYIDNDSTTPVQNWMSGATLLGGSSYAAHNSVLDVVGDIGLTTSLKFNNSGFVISFETPTLAQNTAYVLPATDGTSGYVLSTDGSGTLSWAPSAGSPPVGDPNTMAFFDGAGNLSDQADFTWDATILTVPGHIYPSVDQTYSIGTTGNQFLEVWGTVFESAVTLDVTSGGGDLTLTASGGGTVNINADAGVTISPAGGNVTLNPSTKIIDASASIITNPAGGTATFPITTTSSTFTDSRVTTSCIVIPIFQASTGQTMRACTSNNGTFTIVMAGLTLSAQDFKYVIMDNPS